MPTEPNKGRCGFGPQGAQCSEPRFVLSDKCSSGLRRWRYPAESWEQYTAAIGADNVSALGRAWADIVQGRKDAARWRAEALAAEVNR